MKAIAIQNYGPSGSMLLHSLLDGHPELMTLPGLYPLGIYAGWRLLMEGYCGHPTRDQIVEFLMDRMKPLYDLDHLETSWGLRELGDGQDGHCCVNAEAFRHHLTAALDEGGENLRRAAVRAVYLAYARCLGRDADRCTTLVYPAHSSELQDLRELAEDFPDIRILHTVRDPVDGIFSTVVHNQHWETRLGGSPVDPFTCAIMQMTVDRTPLVERQERFSALHAFEPRLADRCRALRLEDLHAVPSAVMRGVADWIGVTWDESLLQSTFAGKKWWNRPGFRRLSGFNKTMGTTHGIPPFDRRRIAAVTAPVRHQYGYARTGHSERIREGLALLGLAMPFAAERQGWTPRRYLAARVAMARGLLTLRRTTGWVQLLPIPLDGVEQPGLERH